MRRWIYRAGELVLLALLMFVTLPMVVTAAALVQAELPGAFGSNYLLAAALVGAAIPGLIAIINQRSWSSEAKGLVALVMCAGAGALLAYTQGLVDRADVLRSILIVFTIAQVLYQTFWRPSGIAGAIERGTSI